MQEIQGAGGRDFGLQLEGSGRLFHPERRLGGSARRDPQRHGIARVQSLRRQSFEPRNAAAQSPGQFSERSVVGDGHVPELTQVSPLSQPQRFGVSGHPRDLFGSPLEVYAAPLRSQLCVALPVRWSIQASRRDAVSGVLRRVQQHAVYVRMRIEGGIEADQFAQHVALTAGRPGVEGTVPVRQRLVLPRSVVVATVLQAEQDIDQRGAQLANGDVRFAAQVYGLQRLEQPLPSTGTYVVVGKAAGTKGARRAKDRATVLSRTGPTRRPGGRRSFTAVEAVHQVIEKAGVDAVRRYAADERTLVQVDEPHVRIRLTSIFEKVGERVRQRRPPVVMIAFRIVDPLQQPAVVDRQQMSAVLARAAVLKRFEYLVQQLMRRAAFPRRRTVQIHAHGQAVIGLTVHDAGGGAVVAESQTFGEPLEDRGLSVAGISAQHHQADAPRSKVIVQRPLQCCLDVGAGGEVGVQPARLAIAPA